MVDGKQIILDSDLSEFYGMSVAAFNRQRKRRKEFTEETFKLNREQYNEIQLQKGLPISKQGHLPTAYTRRASEAMAFVVSSNVAMKVKDLILDVFEAAVDGRLVPVDSAGRELVKEAEAHTIIHNTYHGPVTLIQGSQNTVHVGCSFEAISAFAQMMMDSQVQQNEQMMSLILEALKEINKKDKPSLLKTVGEMINLGTNLSPIVMKYAPMIQAWIKTL
jgi:polyphosphate kinase